MTTIDLGPWEQPDDEPNSHPAHNPDNPDSDDDNPLGRRIRLTPASAIPPRRVRWFWDKRIAYGTLALLAGREGLGKSTLGYHIAARTTRGTLEGEDHGTGRAVLVCATEDSWAHTIVPRLIAAGADLDMVYRLEMVTHDDITLGISLPKDFAETAAAAEQTGAALLILDPLMSVIDARLDTHKDHEVRRALEPLATLADTHRMAILGLIHHNKGAHTNALDLVMASKAFTAVARSVHTCIPDPDDESQTKRIFATSKNNLGTLDLPVLGFTITNHAVETIDDGTAWTGRIAWTGQVAGTIHELIGRATDPERSATAEAVEWLHDYMTQIGGQTAKTDVEKAARAAGHSVRTLGRARERLRLEHSSAGFPRRTYWALPIIDTDPDTTNPPPSVTEPPPSVDNPAPVVPTDPDHLARLATTSTSQANTERHHQSGQVLPGLAPLGTTDHDLHKHQNQPRAHTRAGGQQEGTTGDLAPLQHPQTPPEPPSQASPANPPARVARLQQTPKPPPKAPTCPMCTFPTDSIGHQANCELP